MDNGKKIVLGTLVCGLALSSGFFNMKQRTVEADAPQEMPE